jgi:hypothetical protein
MNIYIDLDDTLIHSVYGRGRNPGRRTVVNVTEDEIYHSMLRPEASRILGELRKIGNVRMLTTAISDYAEAHNRVFSLGFLESEIFARERYISKVLLAYGSEWVASMTRTDPGALLIDNLSPSTESSRTKCAFLGIGEDNYLQIREFDGKDPACFVEEVDSLLAAVTRRARGEGADAESGILSRAEGGMGDRSAPQGAARL